MKTQDLFAINRTAKKLNETIEKTFGKKLNLEAFDLTQLEDARNKLRTQVHQARNEAGFNENLENEALTQAQWMLDAINSEIAERQELIADAHTAESEYESAGDTPVAGMSRAELLDYLNTTEEQSAGISDDELRDAANEKSQDYAQDNMGEGSEFGAYDYEKLAMGLPDGIEDEKEVLKHGYDLMKSVAGSKKADYLFHYDEDFPSDFVSAYFWLQKNPQEGPNDSSDDAEALASAGHGSDEDYGTFPESAPPTAKGERMVKHIKKGYAKDGKLTDKERSIAYATAWKQHNKDKNESIEGDNMTNLKEGEVQQAGAIVSAKTMVDRVGRWIEDLSGMENDTLLTLGDSIRDEMSAELAKQFISQAAPALQQAIETLKQTRDTLASSVRILTGEEQGAEMIGAEPTDAGADLEAPAEPDALNAEPAVAPDAGDEFAAAEPAAGGLGDAGRAKRESVEFGNNLLKVLAG